jgi:glutamate dehydrogenase (NAD(P)+)
MSRDSFHESVNHYFNRAASFSTLDAGLIDQVRCCNSAYRMRFPVKTDDGTITVIEA